MLTNRFCLSVLTIAFCDIVANSVGFNLQNSYLKIESEWMPLSLG